MHEIIKKMGTYLEGKYKTPKLKKELIEADSIFSYRYKICRNGNVVYDLCTGHGILAAALAKFRRSSLVIGIDKLARQYWDYYYFIQNLLLVQGDIYNYPFDTIPPDVITAIHPCRGLAEQVIRIAAKYEADIYLMPCCVKRGIKRQSVFAQLLNHSQAIDPQYVAWCFHLAEMMEEYGYDVRVRSPKRLRAVTPKSIILIGR